MLKTGVAVRSMNLDVIKLLSNFSEKIQIFLEDFTTADTSGGEERVIDIAHMLPGARLSQNGSVLSA